MKRNNKKGFTIVELVIVIAVIAILAAVLIPTFGNVIDKANASKALQAARNEYTNYMVDHAVDNVDDLIIKGADDAYFAVVNGEMSDTVYASTDAAKAAFTEGTPTVGSQVSGFDVYPVTVAPAQNNG